MTLQRYGQNMWKRRACMEGEMVWTKTEKKGLEIFMLNFIWALR